MEAAQEIPREPFAYMSRLGRSRVKIRSPLGLIFFAAFLMAAGVAAFCIAVAGSTATQGGGAISSGIVALLMFGGLGVTALIIGVKRLRWKRQYVRITGHQPWT